jgi:hypothetical protein
MAISEKRRLVDQILTTVELVAAIKISLSSTAA